MVTRRPPASPASGTLAFVEPMVALKVEELPVGHEWLYEIKLDGYRVLALKDGPALSSSPAIIKTSQRTFRASHGR